MMDKNTKIYVNPTDASSSAGRMGTPSPAARSPSTPTGVGARRRRFGQGSNEGRPFGGTWRATSRRTSRGPASPSALVQLAHAIGVAEPVSVMVHTEGTGTIRKTRSPRSSVSTSSSRPAASWKSLTCAGRSTRRRQRRTLRPHREGVLLGADRQGRGVEKLCRLIVASHQSSVREEAGFDGGPRGRRRRSVGVTSHRVRRRRATHRRTIPSIIHVHTTRSDGASSPEEIAAIAAKVGLKFPCSPTTAMRRASRIRRSIDRRAVPDGVETSTNGGHYVAIDMPASPFRSARLRDAVEDVRRLALESRHTPIRPRRSCTDVMEGRSTASNC